MPGVKQICSSSSWWNSATLSTPGEFDPKHEAARRLRGQRAAREMPGDQRPRLVYLRRIALAQVAQMVIVTAALRKVASVSDSSCDSDIDDTAFSLRNAS